MTHFAFNPCEMFLLAGLVDPHNMYAKKTDYISMTCVCLKYKSWWLRKSNELHLFRKH